MDHSPKFDIPWDLITDSFTGSLSPEDEKIFKAWLLSDQENSEIYARLKGLWENGLDEFMLYQQADESKAWAKLSSKMEPAKTFSQNPLFKINRNHFIRNISAIAAGFLILIAIGYLIFYRNNDVVYKTALGEQREIKLMDGSEVILKEHTRLRVADDYNHASRTISLEEGEATFAVFHQARPFIVKVGPVKVEDLGTNFIVRRSEQKIEVIVSAGKVAFTINKTNETRELTAGSGISFDINGKKIENINDSELRKLVPKAALNFDNAPLSTVIASLQSVYKYKIGIAESATGEKRLTADFDGVSFENMLTIICKSLNLEYSVKDSTYLLTEKSKE
jgi:transmembrane sensor